MPPAWQKRESEQQKYVEHWLDRVTIAAEDYDDPDRFRAELAVFILIELFPENSFWRHLRLTGDFPETRMLLSEFHEAANGFVRVESEIAVLKKRLFDALASTAFLQSLNPYEAEKISNTWRVYGTDRSTDEVEL